MQLGDVQMLVERVATVDASSADRHALESAVAHLRQLRSWVEGREVALARALAEVSSFPEKNLADAGRLSLRQAEQVMHRAKVTETMPGFESSLHAGRVTGDHVDALGRVMRQLEPAARQRLADQAPTLLAVAECATPEEFTKTLRRELKRLETESEADARLQRQRQAMRLSTWIDRDSGMGRWSASWDPQTMLRLENRLDAQVGALFHDTAPEGCPTDLFEKQGYLRALALLAILDGKGVRLGKPEIVVVVDHTQPNPDGTPFVDWGLPIELPQKALDDLAANANTYEVVVRNGQILSAPGKLNQGRSSRLANRAQRRALNAIYSTCAIPGCRVRYARTKLHHVRFFTRDGGMSDLDNFVPLCSHHHQRVHHDDWLLRLAPNRILTIQLPDGSVMTTGPPRRSAA